MNGSGQTRGPAILWIAVIALVLLPICGVGYLVTTFLFAFSGGQYRMVELVNIGALIVFVLGVLVAAVVWRLRTPAAAVGWAAAASGAAWLVAVISEWFISFRLGAS
jgi:hypothetical protein